MLSCHWPAIRHDGHVVSFADVKSFDGTVEIDRFFFSSRRRHTRCSRDWSSDVCSSDLVSRSRTWRVGLRAKRGSPKTKELPLGSQLGFHSELSPGSTASGVPPSFETIWTFQAPPGLEPMNAIRFPSEDQCGKAARIKGSVS